MAPRPPVTSDQSTVEVPDGPVIETLAVKRAPRPASLPEVTRRELSQRAGVGVTVPRAVGSTTPVASQSASRGQSSRSGPSQLDLASRTYTHIRTDLLRIGILAAMMLGVIVTLSFVIV